MPTHSGYVKADEIIADCVAIVDDYGKQFSHGWWISQIQQALAELAMDTYFDKKVWITPVTDNLIVDMPAGMVSIDGVYVYSGTECDAGPSVKVHYARNYTRYGGATFKNQRGGRQNDPVYEELITSSRAQNLLYWGRLDTHMFLSDACSGYGGLMIKGRGLGCDFGSTPTIPHELREAIKNKAAIAAATVLFGKYRDAGRAAVLNNLKKDHFGHGGLDVGSWKQAKRRVQNTGQDEREAIANYLSTFGDKN
jgi:hypothetical protein